MDIEELETAALQLDLKSRARLAELSAEENQQLWLDEAQRRNATMDLDPSRGIPAEQVLREAYDLVRACS